MARNSYLIVGIITLFSVIILLEGGLSSAQSDTTLVSLEMTATAIAPTPTSVPTLSPEAEKALQYVAERADIPASNLLVTDEHPVTYPLIGRSFQLVTMLDTRAVDAREYVVMVDLSDGAIEEDVNAIDAGEEAAAQEKYGKLHPVLYERLQEVGEDELLPVAIWLTAGTNSMSRSDIFNTLVLRYPEAAQALEEWGKPWAVEDHALSQEIHEAYRQMREESVAERVMPLVTELHDTYHVDVTIFEGMPSISTNLPKQVIKLIATRSDVASIYLIEEQGTQTMNTAAWTVRAPAVWQAGYSGSGRRIASVDRNAISDQVPCLNIASTVNSGLPVAPHHTHVASVAACYSDLYPGIAPGAQLIDAGFSSSGNSQENAVLALQQALVNHNADTAFISYVFEYDRKLNWTDRAFDYWA